MNSSRLILVLAMLSWTCKSSLKEKANDGLVKVAVVKFVNASGKDMYDYLSESLTEATKSSMDNKFVYGKVASEKTEQMFKDMQLVSGALDREKIRAHADTMDADLVISGFFTSTTQKRSDVAEIQVIIFRADKAVLIAELKRQSVISGAIFKEVDSLATEIVRQIAEYQKKERKESAAQGTSGADGKIELTRESLNIQPFIPPIF